jgi:hypothetical protein
LEDALLKLLRGLHEVALGKLLLKRAGLDVGSRSREEEGRRPES